MNTDLKFSKLLFNELINHVKKLVVNSEISFSYK